MRALRSLAAAGAVMLLAGVVWAGTCLNCGLVFEGEGKYCAQCARRLASARERAMKELVHVERVAKARREYRKALEALEEYYRSEGNAQKLADVERELGDLKTVRQFDYISLAELLGPDLKPARSIPEADRLYEDGLGYYEHFAWPWQKRRRYSLAIRRFKELLKTYPDSDRIDEAAYYLGRCYESRYFKDYRRAVQWYQRCLDWNPATDLDPRYRIARIYDRKLGQRDKALQYYQMVVRDGTDGKLVERAQRRINEIRRRILEERREAVTRPEE